MGALVGLHLGLELGDHCLLGVVLLTGRGIGRGTALGQANGIQALDRTRQVIALCGDGGFNMLLCEFLTAVQHKLPGKAVVYNNSSLGLIRLEAESMGMPAWKAMDFPNPDYVSLARACGAVGFRAEKPGELHAAIELCSRRKARPLSTAWFRQMNCPTSRTLSWGRLPMSPRQRSRKRAGDPGPIISSLPTK
jgi:thiamine pyrophosphate-dependent acetolactate synthase large subunit-like protein